MKKGWKIYWIISGSAILIGIICCIAAFSLGFTSEMLLERVPQNVTIIESGDVTSGVQEVQGTYQNIRELKVDVFAGEVEIHASDNEDIEVYTAGISKKLDFQCKVDGNELKITTDNRWMIFGNASVGTIDVYIPKDMILNEVSIDVGAGTLYIEDIHADELSIDVGTGEATVAEFDARQIDIDCGVGSIEMTTSASEKDYNYNIDCGVGEVNCGNNSMSGIGDERTINNGANKEMDIDCGVGEITILFLGT